MAGAVTEVLPGAAPAEHLEDGYLICCAHVKKYVIHGIFVGSGSNAPKMVAEAADRVQDHIRWTAAISDPNELAEVHLKGLTDTAAELDERFLSQDRKAAMGMLTVAIGARQEAVVARAGGSCRAFFCCFATRSITELHPPSGAVCSSKVCEVSKAGILLLASPAACQAFGSGRELAEAALARSRDGAVPALVLAQWTAQKAREQALAAGVAAATRAVQRDLGHLTVLASYVGPANGTGTIEELRRIAKKERVMYGEQVYQETVAKDGERRMRNLEMARKLALNGAGSPTGSRGSVLPEQRSRDSTIEGGSMHGSRTSVRESETGASSVRNVPTRLSVQLDRQSDTGGTPRRRFGSSLADVAKKFSDEGGSARDGRPPHGRASATGASARGTPAGRHVRMSDMGSAHGVRNLWLDDNDDDDDDNDLDTAPSDGDHEPRIISCKSGVNLQDVKAVVSKIKAVKGAADTFRGSGASAGKLAAASSLPVTSGPLINGLKSPGARNANGLQSMGSPSNLPTSPVSRVEADSDVRGALHGRVKKLVALKQKRMSETAQA
ncbi:unnamed protein product [Pedinophyceae sp. YPF-701]|nr:unnamed protein product [Pedinophyceae sp. YPF-701]